VSTGAFTSVEADRDVEVTVTADQDAFLSLTHNNDYSGAGGGSSPFTETTGNPNELKLVFGDSGNGGSGVAPDSTYFFEQQIFDIVNQGTTGVGITINQIDQPDPDNDGNSDDDFFFTLTALGFDLQNAEGAAPLGRTVGPGAFMSTGGIDPGQTVSLEVELVAENPADWIENLESDVPAVKPEGEQPTTSYDGQYGP
jgi:hypothetical protein